VVKVSAMPADTLAARLAAAVDSRTAAVMTSSVLFASARIVPGLAEVLAACRAVGAELLVDAYHQMNVVPCDLERDGLDDAFVVGGGYKYCQLGEGNCFLRVPPERERMMGYGNFGKTISTLEAAVSSADYLVGNRFTAADLYVGAQIGFGMMFGTLERRSAFERYWQRLSTRPAYTRATKLDDEQATELKKAAG